MLALPRWPTYMPPQSPGPGSRRGTVTVGVERATGTKPVIAAGREDDLAARQAFRDELGTEGRFDARTLQLDNDAGIDRQASIRPSASHAKRLGAQRHALRGRRSSR